jgi:hypothetical protein
MTDAERREAARLRSERWRRTHGIGPRRKSRGSRKAAAGRHDIGAAIVCVSGRLW